MGRRIGQEEKNLCGTLVRLQLRSSTRWRLTLLRDRAVDVIGIVKMAAVNRLGALNA